MLTSHLYELLRAVEPDRNMSQVAKRDQVSSRTAAEVEDSLGS